MQLCPLSAMQRKYTAQMRLPGKAERFMLALYTVAACIYWFSSDGLISVFALFCRLSVGIALHQNIIDLAGHSAVATDHSQWASLLVATSGWRARPGSIKTPAEFCVEANENALKVNDPQGLNSPPWSHPPTLLVQWPWFTHCLSALTHLHLSSDLPHVPICNSRNLNITKLANSELASRLALPLLALGILR